MRDLLVIGPPLLAKIERQVQAIDQTNLSFPSFLTEQLNEAVRRGREKEKKIENKNVKSRVKE